jgi:YegS/Rv2252/BmrU family lipid kinase
VNVLFLVNPRSGTRRRQNVERLIRDACGDWRVEIVPCDSKDDLDGVIAQAKTSGVEVVYAVGGDGTVHEIAKRLIHTGLALGILPTGSGNGFARHLGVPMDARRSLEACRFGTIVTIDTASVNGIAFVGTMGIGFDAHVAEAFARAGTRGMATYVKVAFRGFAGYRAGDYTLTADGSTTTLRALIIAIANSSQYGNNARIAPLASLQDGLLDVTIIERAPLLGAPLMVARLFNGTLHRSRGVRTMQARSIEIRRAAAGPAHLDGEPVTLPETLRVEIVPRSLRVLVPDEARAI